MRSIPDSRMEVAHPPSRFWRRVRSWSRKTVIIVAVIAVLLIAVRIALPYFVKYKVNERLASIPGYSGRVEGIDIALFRGAYSLNDVAIFKINGAAREPFVMAKNIDFSVAWRELFHRKVVSDIVAEKLEVNFVAAGTDETSQKDIDRRWQDVAKDLFPLEITYMEVKDGAVRYEDLRRQPHVDMFIAHMQLLAIGTLPPSLRPAYGFEWRARDARALARWTALLRTWLRLLPLVAREWPAARARSVGASPLPPMKLLGKETE